AAAVPVALWVVRTRRVAGMLLLYGAVVALLLTYSRFGVVLACLAAAAWVVLERDRVESLAALVLAGGAGAAVFGIALALPGITEDGQPRSVRAHDGWVFALVVLAGAAVVVAAVLALERVGPASPQPRRRLEPPAAPAG